MSPSDDSTPSNPPLFHGQEPFATDRILFEDHHLIVVNKPAPLLTQAPASIPSLEGMVKAYVKVKYAKPAGVYLGVPHRLDRPVSGVLCFTRNTKASQRVHAQFQEHRVRKVYWALVEGAPNPEAGVWEDWIRKMPEESRVERAGEGETGAKLAMLGYRTLQSVEGGSLVELAPLTGRTHQLRVQSAWRGHPVFGDALYGSSRSFGPAAEQQRERAIALHARSLTLQHPFSKQELTFIAPLPEYWPSATGTDTPSTPSES